MRIRAQPLHGWANPASAAARPMHGSGWRQATGDATRSGRKGAYPTINRTGVDARRCARGDDAAPTACPPIGAHNDDLQASGAPWQARMTAAHLPPQPTKRTPAPAAARRHYRCCRHRCRIHRCVSNAGRPTHLRPPRSRYRQTPRMPRQQLHLHEDGNRRTASRSPEHLATCGRHLRPPALPHSRHVNSETVTREQMHRTVFLKLSAPPSDRLTDRAASWNTQTR